MRTIRRLTILAVWLTLLVPGGARGADPSSEIPEGIPVKGIALSKEESRAMHAEAEALQREIARSDEKRAMARVREVMAAGRYYFTDPWPKEANVFAGLREAVLDGIHARLDSPTGPVDASYLAILREYIASTQLGWRFGIWDQAVLNWAASFVELHGDESIALAAQRANDPSLPPADRGLHLAVFELAPGREWDHPQRELALETYRPYLDPGAPPILQEMAVIAATGLWDFDAVKRLEHLAFTSPSFHARSRANALIGQLYIRGPRMEHAIRGRNARNGPYDREGARAWASRREEFWREFNRLIGMEDVAEREKAEAARPPRPSVPMRSVEPSRGEAAEGLPQQPPPARP